MTIAASALIDLSGEKEEKSKSGEETVDKIDDDGDLKPAAKSTHFIIRHDKDSVDITDEGGKGEDKEFDSHFNHDDDDADIDQEGGRGVASSNDTKMAVEHNCAYERTSVGNKEIKDNNDGCNDIDEEGGGSFFDNNDNDGNNSTITKMGNNNISNSEGSTNHREDLSPGKLWYDKFSVIQQCQVEMDIDVVLYAGCMAAARQIFDTTVCQQEADDDYVNNDDDNVVGDWDPDDDLVVGGVLLVTIIKR